MSSETVLSAWQYRRHDEDTWSDATVPTSWEDLGRPLDDSGPYVWRTSIALDGGPARIDFDAVAYHAEVCIDGEPIATHEGMWSPWSVDLSGQPAGVHDLQLTIEKVASLTAGPDSPHRPGRFPTRETPSGFLPYVWGHVPGGIWQEVRLVQGTRAAVRLRTRHADAAVDVLVTGPGSLTWEVADQDHSVVAHGTARDGQWVRIERPEGTPLWHPSDPHLLTLTVRSDGLVAAKRAIGFRGLSVAGSTIELSGRPFYPRLALSWGWYGDRHTPNPAPEVVERDFESLRSLGFNGVKLCLWVPPESYLDVADRIGMAVWLELPMWIPSPNPEFQRRIVDQFREIVDLAVQHPSVVLYTLGCELQANVSLDLLQELFDELSEVVAPALLCDNSGSGEAYGGHDQRLADFFDHHPYGEPHDLAANLDLWAPRFRDPRPWLFGETADQDTFRTPPGEPDLWWWSSSGAVNPQGGRWQHDAPWHAERLAAEDLLRDADELVARSRARGTAMRKWAIEAMRQRPDTSGYVITTERDNPISTAGVLDDEGRVKFDPGQWRQFNADTLVTLAPPRRVRWLDGDRPSPVASGVFASGGLWQTTFVVSQSGAGVAPTSIDWVLSGEGFRCEGTAGRGADPGRLVYECGSAQVRLPSVEVPTRLVLTVDADGATNEWPVWVLPDGPTGEVAVYDPADVLLDWRKALPGAEAVGADRLAVETRPVLALQWHPALRALAERGQRVVLMAGNDDHVATLPRPFWREAIALPRPSAAWGAMPLEHFDELALGIAPRRALEVPEGEYEALLTRVDCRTGQRQEYAYAVGSTIITTLALAGGNGAQPLGLATNVAGTFLLRQWLYAANATQERPDHT